MKASTLNCASGGSQEITLILLITGRFDDIAPPEEMEAILDKISSKDKELIIIPEAGHDPALDQPDIFQATISNFVQ
ncbi:MAG: alpha/beta hydrolase [Bacteroidota bacterium]